MKHRERIHVRIRHDDRARIKVLESQLSETRQRLSSALDREEGLASTCRELRKEMWRWEERAEDYLEEWEIDQEQFTEVIEERDILLAACKAIIDLVAPLSRTTGGDNDTWENAVRLVREAVKEVEDR